PPTPTSTTHTYTLSLHDALPISDPCAKVKRIREIGRSADIPVRCNSRTNIRFRKTPRPGWLSPVAADRNVRAPTEDFLALALHADRKSTRLNSSHVAISYAVFCL